MPDRNGAGGPDPAIGGSVAAIVGGASTHRQVLGGGEIDARGSSSGGRRKGVPTPLLSPCSERHPSSGASYLGFSAQWTLEPETPGDDSTLAHAWAISRAVAPTARSPSEAARDARRAHPGEPYGHCRPPESGDHEIARPICSKPCRVRAAPVVSPFASRMAMASAATVLASSVCPARKRASAR
jgi:hypothetical protein